MTHQWHWIRSCQLNYPGLVCLLSLQLTEISELRIGYKSSQATNAHDNSNTYLRPHTISPSPSSKDQWSSQAFVPYFDSATLSVYIELISILVIHRTHCIISLTPALSMASKPANGILDAVGSIILKFCYSYLKIRPTCCGFSIY
jgi:hypothetical protein